jgi:hypothetical protein
VRIPSKAATNIANVNLPSPSISDKDCGIALYRGIDAEKPRKNQNTNYQDNKQRSHTRSHLFASTMKDDLLDALVPVQWAQAQMPVLQDRILAWQRTYPFKIVTEPDPDRGDRELLVAYLEKPLDPLIVGDVGAMINSIRTGLNLMMTAVVARHGVPNRAPDFPIAETASDFLATIKKMESKKWISSLEAAVIERTKAYNGGDGILWHIGKLDNLRKHQRLLTVEPIPSRAHVLVQPYGFDREASGFSHMTTNACGGLSLRSPRI